MNIEIRKTLTYRLVATLLLLISLGVAGFSLAETIIMRPEELALTLVAILLTAAFIILEMIFILSGWKKESNLYKIAFNENRHLNNVPLTAVIIGTALAVGLTLLGIFVFFLRAETYIKTSMLVVLTIASYLLVNCFIYYFYIILFRNRPINLRDFIE